MSGNRTRASVLTVLSSTGAQVLIILSQFLVRSVFIYQLGEAYLGVSGLFQNVLGLLSLAELGIGSAITYYLYKPAAFGDRERVKSLMHLYKFCYNAIGGVILFVGLLLMPFLRYLVNMDAELPINLYLVYYLYVVDTAITYLLYAYKIAIFTAYQQMYKVAGIQAVTKVGSSVLSVILLYLTHNFYAYLISLILATVVQNLLISRIADKNFPFLADKDYTKISRSELKDIFKNIYAVFVFKLGNASLDSTDNILISIICGTVTVGYYSNYSLIVRAVTTVYNAILNAIMPSVGNLNAEADDDKQLKTLRGLNFINSWILSFCAISLMILLKPFIFLWTRYTGNENYVLAESISVIVGLNFWIKWYMKIIGQFKDTKGLFWYGKYFQLWEGIGNLLLSIYMGHLFGLTGIVLATTISMLVIGFLPYPYFLFRYGYHRSVFPFYLVCLKDLLLMLLGYGVVRMLSLWIVHASVLTFIFQCVLCLTVPNLIIYLVRRRSPEMQMVKELSAKITRMITRK